MLVALMWGLSQLAVVASGVREKAGKLFMMAFYERHKVIETPRLVLRKFTYRDAQQVFDSWMSDEVVASTVNWEPHKNVQVTKRVIHAWEQMYRRGEFYNWAIVLKGTERIIGSIDFHDVSQIGRTADIGYCIARDCWGQGFATEALKAVLDYGFSVLHLERVSAEYLWENPASGRVMEKAGMHFESDKKIVHKNKVKDSRVYVMAQTDYLKKKEAGEF